MHNHVLADDDQSSLDSLGHRSSLSCLQASDLWEDSMTVYRQPIVTEWVLHLSGYNSRWLWILSSLTTPPSPNSCIHCSVLVCTETTLMHYVIISWELGPVVHKPRGATELLVVAFCLESQRASILHVMRSLGKPVIPNICLFPRLSHLEISYYYINSINKKVEEQFFEISPQY